jgi:hypothetical protein
MSTMARASWFGSRGRFGVLLMRSDYRRSGLAREGNFKLTHYPNLRRREDGSVVVGRRVRGTA